MQTISILTEEFNWLFFPYGFFLFEQRVLVWERERAREVIIQYHHNDSSRWDPGWFIFFSKGCSVPVRTIGRCTVKLVFIGPFKDDPVLLVSRCRLISAGPLPGKPMVSCRICDWAAFEIKHNSVVPLLSTVWYSQKQPNDDDNEFRLNPQLKHICFWFNYGYTCRL